MADDAHLTPLPCETVLDNAVVGEGTIIEPDVTIGFRYHNECGPARIKPLPKDLDRPTNRDLTMPKLDLWHPLETGNDMPDWPDEWHTQ